MAVLLHSILSLFHASSQQSPDSSRKPLAGQLSPIKLSSIKDTNQAFNQYQIAVRRGSFPHTPTPLRGMKGQSCCEPYQILDPPNPLSHQRANPMKNGRVPIDFPPILNHKQLPRPLPRVRRTIEIPNGNLLWLMVVR